MDKKMNEKVSTKQNKSSKIVIKNKRKFLTFLFFGALIIVITIFLIVSNLKVKIASDTDISKLEAQKYAKEIKTEYDKQEYKEQFEKDWDKIQDGVGRYFIENYTTGDGEANKLVDSVNKVLKSDDWESLALRNPKTWNGVWSIDENGNVKFKFASKEIEPSWISSYLEKGYIISN